MGLYRTVCYKVEDVFVKLLSKNQDHEIIKEKVEKYRAEKEKVRIEKQALLKKKTEEQQRLNQQKQAEKDKLRREQEQRERRELEVLLSKVLVNHHNASPYEVNEIKANKHFFHSLSQQIFEPNEKALAFIYCEFDKSKKEIKGYLVPTTNRILFLSKNLSFMEKFRYQTVVDVKWFKDGFMERGLKIQYGKRRKLEFDEMFDQEQMQKVGNVILNHSSSKAI